MTDHSVIVLGGSGQVGSVVIKALMTSPRCRQVNMGMKEDTIPVVGFPRLAISQPGIIAGNSHTLGYMAALGRLLPSRGGTMEQGDIGKAFVRELERGDDAGTTILRKRDTLTG